MDSIICPACQSRISPDGKNLIERSAKIEELEAESASLGKLETAIKTLEKKLEKQANDSKSMEEKTKTADGGDRKPWFQRS